MGAIIESFCHSSFCKKWDFFDADSEKSGAWFFCRGKTMKRNVYSINKKIYTKWDLIVSPLVARLSFTLSITIYFQHALSSCNLNSVTSKLAITYRK